ncbi:KN motif and ankyrin repeat domain-containing protein 4 [Protopterus annectens]|uniref:KN motif and ankyrin repeat domain-containing protein 4 n=1 Tax=Protopterus annectens TaxID=7888 RepID=UPI001CFA5B54|nr:KN motif and ankyrin repeat domain-containing protein 4 [Protopterus annectens]
MDEANDSSMKTMEDRDNQRQMRYSVETPYGFHLDLDFLKYVDDIEKGNTLRRVQINRKTRHPKFSTLPRNFSVPDDGSCLHRLPFPGRGWTSSCSVIPKSKVVGAKEVFDNDASQIVNSSHELNFTTNSLPAEESIRPYHKHFASSSFKPPLLRASSMPVTLLPTRMSEELRNVPPDSFHCNGLNSSDNISYPASETFDTSSTDSIGWIGLEDHSQLDQIQAALKRIKELEEQVKSISELQKQVLELQQERTQLKTQLLQLSSTADTKTNESTKFLKERHVGVIENNADSDANSKHIQMHPTVLGITALLPRKNGGCNYFQGMELNISENDLVDEPVKAEHRSIGVTVTEEDLRLDPMANISRDCLNTASNTKVADLEKQLISTIQKLEKNKDILKQQEDDIKAKDASILRFLQKITQLETEQKSAETKEIATRKMSVDPIMYCHVASNTETFGGFEQNNACDKVITAQMQTATQSVGCGECSVDVSVTPIKELVSVGVNVNCSDESTTQMTAKEATLCKVVDKVISEKAVQTEDIHVSEIPYYRRASVKESINLESREVNKCIQPQPDDCSSQAFTFDHAECKSASKDEQSFVAMHEVNTEEKEHHQTKSSHSAVNAAISQCVKRIQELVQEQWICLEHGYPELASVLKQPASKLSSIQRQLVNSINALSAVYSSQSSDVTQEQSMECQQPETSPMTALKSIMKKKDCKFSNGENGAKKNLQFVGVNGGYETTSSEDSSSDEDLEEDAADLEDKWSKLAECPAECPPKCPPEAISEGLPAVLSGSESVKNEDNELQKVEDNTTTESVEESESPVITAEFISACSLLNNHLSELRNTADKQLRQTLCSTCQEWFTVSSLKESDPAAVEIYVEKFRSISDDILEMFVNVADGNGNTALHYSISHSNFDIVRLLLNTGMCNVNHQNKAGYTAVMLAALASAETEEDMKVVMRLFKQGNLNIRATQEGQTALLLATSHGRADMVKALISCGADVNLQDDDGTSALLCACEHGHLEIVKILLAQPECNIKLTNKSGEGALSIAVNAAYEDITELLKVHSEQTVSSAQ